MTPKRLVQMLLFAILLAVPLALMAQGSKVDELVSQGQQYFNNGDYKQALSEYKQALRQDAESSAAATGLGNAAMQLQDWPSAKRGYEIAHRLSPGDCSITKSLAYVYMRLKLTNRAVSTYDKVVGKMGSPGCEPGDNFSRTNLAGLLVKSKKESDKTRAIQLLNQVINTETEDEDLLFRAHFMLGNLYRGRKNYDKAVEHMEKAFELQPERTDGRYNLGLIYFNRQNYDKALEHLKLAFEEKQNDYRINLMLGYCYKEMPKATTDAIFHLQKAANLVQVLSKKPTKNLPHLELAKLYNKKNKPTDALKVVAEGLKMASNSSDKAGLICVRGKAYEKQGKFEKAIDEFDGVIDDPTWGSYATKQIARMESLIQRREMQSGK